MSRLRRVLRFVFAAGVPGAANPLIAVETLAVAALGLSLTVDRAPEPEPTPVVVICRTGDVRCPRMDDELRIEMQELRP